MQKLAIDLGTKRCGFAISDPSNSFAIALDQIEIDNNFELVIDRVMDIMRNYSIDLVIIGLPLLSNHTVGVWAQRVISFGHELSTRLGVEVHYQDERGSSRASQQLLIEAGYKRGHRRRAKDRAAAAYILEEFLQRLNR